MIDKKLIIESISKRIEELSKDDLLKLDGFINNLILVDKKQSGIDKKNLMKIVESNGYKDFKSIAKAIEEADLLKGKNWEYTPRGYVIQWLEFEFECSEIQAEAIIKIMLMHGYLAQSSLGNISVSEKAIK